MSQFSVELYKPQYKKLWDDFVTKANVDSFIFYRDFIEYHEDRFNDFSLLIFKDQKVVALLPANRLKNNIYSHQGLTFAGLITKINFLNSQYSELLEILKKFLKSHNILELIIKETPLIYYENHDLIITEFMQLNFENFHQNEILAIDYSKPLNIHKTKLKHYRKSDKFDFKIIQTNNFKPFWEQVLEPKLSLKYGAKPVHSLDEIILLSNRFPNNIKQFDVYLENKILAGITVFENETIVKSQYGAVNKEGEKVRALDFLFLHLIEKYKSEGKKFFSMGTVTNKNLPDGYNKGLLKQKQELGCEIFNQNFFKLEL